MKSSTTTIAQSNAFVTTFDVSPNGSGPLTGLRFAVKDTIDVAGFKTGCGNPTWRDSHPAAVVHAVCVEQLLRAGARCVGKTISDELALSLLGENYFYGTPLDPPGTRSGGFCVGNGYGRLYPRSREQLRNLGLPSVARICIGCWRESASAIFRYRRRPRAERRCAGKGGTRSVGRRTGVREQTRNDLFDQRDLRACRCRRSGSFVRADAAATQNIRRRRAGVIAARAGC